MNHPKISVIILNWNGLEDTIECLESLRKATYPNYDVVLVDNGSEGNDVRILREKFGNYIHIIENDRNYGFAEGMNIGMRNALHDSNPDYFLLLNNDTVVAPNCLAELVKVAESDPLIGIVGPKIRWYHDPNRIQSVGGQLNWWTGQRYLIGYNQIDQGQFDEVREVDWVSGAALLIRRRTVADIGLLHAEYFLYSEEVDWCARCRKAGYKVAFAPAAEVWHKCEWETKGIGRYQLYYMTRNRYLFMRRNATRQQFTFFLIQFTLKSLLLVPAWLLLRRRNPKLLLTLFKAIYDGIRISLKGSANAGVLPTAKYRREQH